MSSFAAPNSTGSMRSICWGSALRHSSCHGCHEDGFAIGWAGPWNVIESQAALCCSFESLAEHQGLNSWACRWSNFMDHFGDALLFPITASSGKFAFACFRYSLSSYSVISGWASASSWCSSQLWGRIQRTHKKGQNGSSRDWQVEPLTEQRDSASLRILVHHACWCQSQSSWTSYRMMMGCFHFAPLLWSHQINFDSNCSNLDMHNLQDSLILFAYCNWFDWMESALPLPIAAAYTPFWGGLANEHLRPAALQTGFDDASPPFDQPDDFQ